MSKNTKEKFVVTINNETLPISKTRKYDSGFYKIGDNKVKDSGDCYLMENGSYYRVETEQIVWDYSTNEYSFTKGLTFGIIDDKLTRGYFKKDMNSVIVEMEDSYRMYALNKSVIEKNYAFREKLSDGNFYHISRMKAYDFIKKVPPTNDYKTSLPYDSKDILEQNIMNYEKHYIPSLKLNNEENISKLIQDLSFGLEFETIAGQIPKNIHNRLGLIPLRDGSIAGLEYVTIPLSGVKGICNIVESVKELKYRTEYNDTCSMHLHIGNIPRTPEFITAFFKLTLALQDEIFSMFNLYKKYNFKYKNKNYSAPFNTYDILSRLDPVITKDNLIKNFDVIFTELSEGYSLETYGDRGDLSNVNHHPKDPSGHQKWNIHSRYKIHNMVPLIFGNKKTIEFRIHTPTYDIDKIMFFIFINSILVNFTKANSERILQQNEKHNLTDIISSYCEENKINFSFYINIINYISDRKKFVEDKNRKGDIYFKESEFNCGREFDIKSSSSSKTSGIGLQYLDGVPQYKSFSVSDLKAAVDAVSKSSLKSKRGGQIPQFKISKETEEYLKLKDEAFEKALESYSESYKQDISYYTNSAEIKLEPVVLGHSSPPENLKLNEKSKDNLPW